MRKKKKNVLYLFLYVVLILLLFGGVLLNQLTDYILESRKTPDYKDIVGVIKNATNNYIQNNPELKNKLFYTNRFIDIDVKTLVDGGFLNGNLYNPKKRKNISLDEKIRITATTNNLVNIVYPVKNESEGYHFSVSSLILDYGESKSFCEDDYMLYKGLVGTNFEGVTKYKMGLVYYSNDSNKSGVYYKNNYFGEPINLTVSSCNVNTHIAGNYEVEYKYTDFDKKEQSFKRNIIIKRAPTDILRVNATINDNNELHYKDDKIKITIEEEYVDKRIIKNDYYINNVDGNYKILDANGSETNYLIEYFTTEKIGKNLICVIKNKTINSDLSKVKAIEKKYSVDLPAPNDPVINRVDNTLLFSGNETSSVKTSYYHSCNEKKQDKEGDSVKISSKCKNYYVKACNTSKCSNVVKYSIE